MSSSRSRLLLNMAIILAVTVLVDGHGRLIEPPGRSSMWRFTSTNALIQPYASMVEANYNDNELFCGGFAYQQNLGGKCGVCGDPYDAPTRENEAGGKYAKGIIVEQYAIGQIIPVKIDITASHKGYFEFRLCPVNDPDIAATKECLDANLLRLANGDTKYELPNNAQGAHIYSLNVQLPENLQCSQCVLQWRYHTGNSWGVGTDGIGCIGCGPQEEFYGCADIAIGEEMVSPTSTGLTTATQQQQFSSPSTSTTTTTTEDEGGETQCIEGEYLPNNCTSYFWCVNSVTIPRGCPEGTVVSQNGPPECNWPFLVTPPCGTLESLKNQWTNYADSEKYLWK